MDTFDPYAPPQVSDVKPLGSLAQSARGKELNQARGILIVVGVMTLIFNGFLLYNLPNEVQQEIGANNVPADQVEEFTQTVTGYGYLLYGVPFLLGFVFIGLGTFVKKFPVPMTVLGLVLYVGAALVFAMLNPETLGQGIIVRIFFIIGLVRAIKAARAYQAETRAMIAEGLVVQ